MIEYKGYIGHIEFDDEANFFHGEVINTRDVITFQGCSIDELRQALRDSVEAYLAFCAKRGREPNKPFSGKILVRLTPDQHQKIFIAATREGESLNRWIARTLENMADHQTHCAKMQKRKLPAR